MDVHIYADIPSIYSINGCKKCLGPCSQFSNNFKVLQICIFWPKRRSPGNSNPKKYKFKTTFLEIRWKPQMIRPSFSIQNMYECVWNELLDLFSFWYANLMNTVTEKGLVHLMYQTVLIFVNFFGQVCFTLVLYNIYADHTNIDDMMTKFVRLVIPIYYCILYSTYF